MKRRNFLRTAVGSLTVASVLGKSDSILNSNGSGNAGTAVFAAEQASPTDRLHVTINQYTAGSYFGRDGVDFMQNLDKCLTEMREVGADGLEPMINTEADSEFFGKALKKNKMEMRSIYMSANLHDKDAADAEMERVIKAAKKAAEYGTKVVVINPAAKDGKTDDELILQSKNMNKLGEQLRKHGVKLAFHYHTSELGFAAREFHHLLCGTEPENLGLCFDVHWSYRASGNSAVSAYDHAKLYGDRVVELHLRQSKDGVWTELFGDGDINYKWVADYIAKLGKKPHIVLEQAAENGTPNTMKTDEVFKKSVATVRDMFAAYK
ncbi:MAG: sugar phosphate isomerase/epimerase family protein [Thermoguttaceae bacterium]